MLKRFFLQSVVRSLHQLSKTQPSVNPFATISSTKNQIKNSVLKNRKTTLTAVAFHFVAAVQEHDNFKTLVN